VKLLLNTHAFVWWDGDRNKLSAAVLEACYSPANSLHLSLVSVWELQIKMQLGKLSLRLPLADILQEQQDGNGLIILPITAADIFGLSALPAHHRDPFDRLLVSQTQRGDFHLISHDAEIAQYDVRILY
jgi:PIN domain nuclease of toxin-antitoxin system